MRRGVVGPRTEPRSAGPTQQDQAISPHRLLSLVVILTFAWGTLS